MARRLEDTPTSKIRSAAQSYIELTGLGHSLPINPILGRLTQQPCAWYRYRIETIAYRHTNNGTQRYWQLVDQGISEGPFLLQDDTGECVVLPEGAQIIPTGTTQWKGHSLKASPPPKTFWGWLFTSSFGRFRYTEERLELETPLFATGRFHTLRKDSALANSYPILQTYIEHLQSLEIHVLCQKGLAKDKTFIISSLSQDKLIRTLKWRAAAFFIAFVGFAVLFVHFSYPVIANGGIRF